jgi:hypothetical protein
MAEWSATLNTDPATSSVPKKGWAIVSKGPRNTTLYFNGEAVPHVTGLTYSAYGSELPKLKIEIIIPEVKIMSDTTEE